MLKFGLNSGQYSRTTTTRSGWTCSVVELQWEIPATKPPRQRHRRHAEPARRVGRFLGRELRGSSSSATSYRD